MIPSHIILQMPIITTNSHSRHTTQGMFEIGKSLKDHNWANQSSGMKREEWYRRCLSSETDSASYHSKQEGGITSILPPIHSGPSCPHRSIHHHCLQWRYSCADTSQLETTPAQSREPGLGGCSGPEADPEGCPGNHQEVETVWQWAERRIWRRAEARKECQKVDEGTGKWGCAAGGRGDGGTWARTAAH